jgi:hypothetical protein
VIVLEVKENTAAITIQQVRKGIPVSSVVSLVNLTSRTPTSNFGLNIVTLEKIFIYNYMNE